MSFIFEMCSFKRIPAGGDGYAFPQITVENAQVTTLHGSFTRSSVKPEHVRWRFDHMQCGDAQSWSERESEKISRREG